MGTNFYAIQEGCQHCGSPEKEIHIGKSSGGWCFALATHPELGLTSLAAWKRFVRGRAIKDEYGQTIRPAELWRTIQRRHFRRATPPTPEFLEQNHAILGPNGLLRSRADGRFCIGHGAGTWDLMKGEFL